MKARAMATIHVLLSTILNKTANPLLTLVSLNIILYFSITIIQKDIHINYFELGCGGNENNFLTHQVCMKTCANLDKNFTAEGKTN